MLEAMNEEGVDACYFVPHVAIHHQFIYDSLRMEHL